MIKRLLISAILVSVTTFNCLGQINTLPASQTVLKQAYAQAAAQHKNVLLMFHASWCGWCRKMEASLNDSTCKKFFDDNYVIARLDVLERAGKTDLENPGSLDVLKQYKGDKAGLPFWLILDAKGNLLADSEIRPAGTPLTTPGDNMGCPADDAEVAYFAQLLKATSKLTDVQLAIIGKRFVQNKPIAKPAATH